MKYPENSKNNPPAITSNLESVLPFHLCLWFCLCKPTLPVPWILGRNLSEFLSPGRVLGTRWGPGTGWTLILEIPSSLNDSMIFKSVCAKPGSSWRKITLGAWVLSLETPSGVKIHLPMGHHNGLQGPCSSLCCWDGQSWSWGSFFQDWVQGWHPLSQPWGPSLPHVQPWSVPSWNCAGIVSFPACGLLGKGEEIKSWKYWGSGWQGRGKEGV